MFDFFTYYFLEFTSSSSSSSSSSSLGVAWGFFGRYLSPKISEKSPSNLIFTITTTATTTIIITSLHVQKLLPNLIFEPGKIQKNRKFWGWSGMLWGVSGGHP